MVAFVKNDMLYGQRVGKSGNLVGSGLQISNNLARRDIAIAFDGTNYLVVWVEKIEYTDKDVYGQFVSASGQLVGTNFLIDDGPYFSDNPVSVAFDGSRYMVVFHEEVNNEWDLFARFVTTSGTVAERITITDEPGNQQFPSIAFDGTNYLITWIDFINLDTAYCKGRFFNTSGAPVDTVFTIFAPLGDKIPIGGVMGYDGSQYFLGCNRVIADTTDGHFEFTDGDVYGAFIPPYTEVVEKPDDRLEVVDFHLKQNVPNPFNAATSIQYVLPRNGFVRLAVYNITGQLVRTLVKGKKCTGTHTVSWNGRDEQGRSVNSGIYFCCLETGNFKSTRKMLLLK
jgi:hypothetical protein